MGILDNGIDLSGVDESASGDYSPVPDGQYTIEALKFEDRVYNSGNAGIDIQFTITGPTNQNRRIFETFVLTGNNTTVAMGRIKAFMRAAGIDVDNVPLNNQTLSQAMNTPVEANIGTKPGSNGYPPKNNVKSFLADNTAPAVAAPQQAQAPAPQANQPAGQQVNWQE
tara:strand:+ start:317 stop:820 length:504 start_codon:yes stop_codon:yes gene_type:complete